ncbi:MAG: glycoside hydrolase family 11 protein [Lachnospiraceae bacterium]|nr:glycoside hydrolase family 11 protein [Lachnospiraceae bacterium]
MKEEKDSHKPVKDYSNMTTLTENTIGEEDGCGYELWKDSGDTTMVLTGNGTFTCEWKNINNALFRRGTKFDCTQTYREIGNIAVDYEVDYHPDGNSYLCIYGWTREPLVEYYIVESWGSWRPPGKEPIGTITVDGAGYDVYRTVRVNQPSIDGNTTFEQYWSVRQEKSTKGTVNIASHFVAWENLGLKMGKIYEASLTVEGYQSTGSAEVLKNELIVGKEIIEPKLPD